MFCWSDSVAVEGLTEVKTRTMTERSRMQKVKSYFELYVP